MEADFPSTSPAPLLVVTTAKAGGAERVLAYLVGRLPALGFEPTVLLLEPGPIQGWLAEMGCARVVVADSLEQVPALTRRLIHETRAQLLLSKKWNAHLHGGRAARDAGIPAVWWQPDVPRPTPRQLEAAACPAAAIVCSSDLVIDAQRRLTPRARIVKIQPGIPVHAYASKRGDGADVRHVLGWESAPLVGIVGRLQHFKAQHIFIKAAALVAERRPDVRFVVVGGAVLGTEGGYPTWLESLTRQRGLTDRLRLVGQQRQVAPWFAALDVAVHATDGEPFGLVILEAMASGTPIVATNVGGPSEIIDDGKSGLLVPPAQPVATAEATLRLLEEPHLRARLSSAGRRRARLFTVERMSDAFASLFRSLLDSQQPRDAAGDLLPAR
jgi:glycosyltransferase involved in cell wall biosynthesis